MSKVRYEAQEKLTILSFFLDCSSVAENGAHRKKTYERRFDERNTAYASSPLLNFDAAAAAARAVSNHGEKSQFRPTFDLMNHDLTSRVLIRRSTNMRLTIRCELSRETDRRAIGKLIFSSLRRPGDLLPSDGEGI